MTTFDARRAMTTSLLAAILALGALVASAATAPSVAAACRYSSYATTTKTALDAGSSAGHRVTATSTVVWRYHYDCNYSIVAIEIDSRSIQITVDGRENYLCCYERHVQSNFVKWHWSGTAQYDEGWPNQRCRAAYCAFPRWTDGGNVVIPYRYKAFSVTNAPQLPHVRTWCIACHPSGWGDIAIEHWFAHGQMRVSTDPWGGDGIR